MRCTSRKWDDWCTSVCCYWPKLGTQTDWRPHIIPKGTTWRHPACFWIQAIQDSKMLKVAPLPHEAGVCLGKCPAGPWPKPSWSQLKLQTLVAPAPRLPKIRERCSNHHYHGSQLAGCWIQDDPRWSKMILNLDQYPTITTSNGGGNIAPIAPHEAQSHDLRSQWRSQPSSIWLPRWRNPCNNFLQRQNLNCLIPEISSCSCCRWRQTRTVT